MSKRSFIWSLAGLILLAVLFLAIGLIIRYWQIVSGLFWTLVFASLLAFAAFKFTEFFRYNPENRRARFHPAWSILPTVFVFFLVWSFGYNVTMLGWEIKPIEQEFLHHANYDSYTIEGGQMNYHGSLDQILAKRDALLKKRHAKMVGEWWTNTDTGSQINAYYDYDFWWWLHK